MIRAPQHNRYPFPLKCFRTDEIFMLDERRLGIITGEPAPYPDYLFIIEDVGTPKQRRVMRYAHHTVYALTIDQAIVIARRHALERD